MNTADGVEDIQSIVMDDFGADRSVHTLRVMADDHLSNNLGFVQSVSIDGDTERTKTYAIDVNGMSRVTDEEKTLSAGMLKLAQQKGSLTLGEIDYTLMHKQYEEAVAMLPEEFENPYLNQFTFNVDRNNQLTTDLTIEATKVGEDSEMEGLREVINYYEFNFEGEADGTVVYNE